MKKDMKNKMWIIYVIGGSLCVSVLSHLFILHEWMGDTYFIGIRDGMSQMLPFKELLYDNYTNGNFFYAADFGMGGGTYAQLGYYYSTSLIFIATVIVTYVLEVFGIIQHPSLAYWADAVLIVSIIRMVIITLVATIFIRSFGFKTRFAFVGAIIYATSTIYFRHVVYWEFFADAMIWLPLLLLGIERIIRGKSSILFIIAVAIHMIDNFYFAYINFGIALIYIIGRMMVPFEEDIRTIPAQLIRYTLGGLAGLGLSAFAFIPTVYGYLKNDRPLFTESFPVYDFIDNPLLNGRIIVIPAIIIACLWIFNLYACKKFRFFACLTLLMIGMHFSPYVASMFNGFSAPQYRWEYALILVGAVLVTYVLSNVKELTRASIIVSLIGTVGTYAYFYVIDPDIHVTSDEIHYLVLNAALIIITIALLLLKRSPAMPYILATVVLISSVWIANGFQSEKVTFAGTDEEVTKKWMSSDDYNGEDQRELIDLLQVREKDPLMRIDWMIKERNNTPLVQDFRGFSAYSSILNENVLHFYWNDLMIDMGRESVSRYGTLGDRTNMLSLLYGKYQIKEMDEQSIPFGFEEVATIGSYVAYENTYPLSFARTTNKVYTEESLKDAHPIERERAMIDGVILENYPAKEPIDSLKATQMEDITIQTSGSSYEDDILSVTSDRGGLDLIINDVEDHVGDYYVSFYMKRKDKDKLYHLSVNNYETSRKKNTSIYRTGIDDIVIRVPAERVLSIRVPEGEYELKDIEVYQETYEILEEEVNRQEKGNDTSVTMDKNKVYMNVQNEENGAFVVIPVPYEEGWSAKVNGEKADVLQANYSFISVPIEKGENDITLTYIPPYLLEMGMLSLGTCIGLMVFYRIRKKVR